MNVGIFPGKESKAQIGFVLLDEVVNILGMGRKDAQMEIANVLMQKIGNARYSLSVETTQGGNGKDRPLVLHVLGLFPKALHLIGNGEEIFSCLSQAQRFHALAPFDQRQMEALFQLLQALAHRRLGNIQALCRLGNVERPGDHNKNADIRTVVHKQDLLLLYGTYYSLNQ